MIELRDLTKRYGDRTAVHGLTLTVEPGKVTGFLGPNGAGKSTTMRMILGLDRPTSGTALIGGRPYAAFPRPLREVGALLDAKALHPGRSARAHLVALARSNGIPAARVDEALETVGLAEVARRRAGTFSLGMGQRLGIAGALLGDPRVLLFDEPVNGLDPDGVLWVRRLMRSLAAEGRTVFVSSHLMSEMELTADRLVVIGKGRLIADAPVAEVIARSSRNAVRLRSPRLDLLVPHLSNADLRRTGPDALTISGVPIERLGTLCHELGVPVLELSPQAASLEEAYMELTGGSVEYGVAADRTEKAGAR
ncbi:ABC transporter ATP-binding protein [Spirillospora sp. NPDC127200]